MTESSIWIFLVVQIFVIQLLYHILVRWIANIEHQTKTNKIDINTIMENLKEVVP